MIENSVQSDGKAPRHYTLVAANPKGHSRMILDVAWSTNDRMPLFATAGRDKTVKIWVPSNNEKHDYTLRMTITRSAPVTAIDFKSDCEENLVCLAVGEETGRLSYHIMSADSFRESGSQQAELLKSVDIQQMFCPSRAVTRLAWRPHGVHRGGNEAPAQLAIASADSSLRILSISWQHRKAHGMETG